jgi:protein CpxP
MTAPYHHSGFAMNFFPRHAFAMLGCACIVSAAAISAEPDNAPPPGRTMQDEGPGPMHHRGHGRGPMLPPGVHLDEAQQDKVFAIVHAQEPRMREQEKAARHAHEALRAMATSGQFDDARASALAQAGAQAMAAMALQRARTDAQINALLTPEQRRQADEHGRRRESRNESRNELRQDPRQ